MDYSLFEAYFCKERLSYSRNLAALQRHRFWYIIMSVPPGHKMKCAENDRDAWIISKYSLLLSSKLSFDSLKLNLYPWPALLQRNATS